MYSLFMVATYMILECHQTPSKHSHMHKLLKTLYCLMCVLIGMTESAFLWDFNMQGLFDSGYSAIDIITTIFRVTRNSTIAEFVKLEFLKVCVPKWFWGCFVACPEKALCYIILGQFCLYRPIWKGCIVCYHTSLRVAGAKEFQQLTILLAFAIANKDLACDTKLFDTTKQW